MLSVFFLFITLGATSADAARIEASTIVHDLFHVGPIRSFVVQQDGELLIEEYRGGMHAGRTINIKSASKSILSLLVGIAIEQGHLDGVNQKIGGFFPDYFKAHPT